MAEDRTASDKQRSPTDRNVIGYVVGDTEEAVTLCTECEPEWNTEIPRTEIRDSSRYGVQVPYPECFHCARVIRAHDAGSGGGQSDE